MSVIRKKATKKHANNVEHGLNIYYEKKHANNVEHGLNIYYETIYYNNYVKHENAGL